MGGASVVGTFHFRLQAAVSLKKGIGSSFAIEDTGEASYLLYLLYSVIQFLHEKNLDRNWSSAKALG